MLPEHISTQHGKRVLKHSDGVTATNAAIGVGASENGGTSTCPRSRDFQPLL
jgi:hypothetical protein